MSSNQPLSETDGIFARAYASALKDNFQVDVGDRYAIYTSPVNLRGIAAGDLIYPQITNYQIYKFADSLQYSDNPSYIGGSAGSYLQQLNSYITWARSESDPSPEIADRMSKAREAVEAATTNYSVVVTQAQNQWIKVQKLYPNDDFWRWIAQGNYPLLDVADRTRKATQSEAYLAMQAYFGPDSATYSGFIGGIDSAFNMSNPLPGYNQSGLIDNPGLISKAIDDANRGVKPLDSNISQSFAFVPLYTIQTYINTVQSWITAANQGAKRDQKITIDINQGRQTTWEDCGFGEVRGGGGFWPFLHAEVYVDDRKEERTLKTEGREDSISLSLSMIGVQKFDVRAGLWDIPNIKALFPHRAPGAPPEVLSSKFTQIVSVLVGFDVELKVEFASEMREEVDKIYEEVKKTGGNMTVLGFRVSAGASGGVDGSDNHVETKFDDVKWSRKTGSMNMTQNSGQVCPTILAVVGQKFE
ncbi:hypothetical protein D9757_013498 [Collybiopsis confluens]|uniref:Uncharacterized protein n=1 Tax=Collybiopsis confluens TaxID=2823264 RepID=A0A8H5FS68_9AGAR|nr:hypothetical protein D9757_013498 [Collybiopsis confluens]